MARVYPNGLADVNHFHAAGGLGYMIGELLDAGLLHPDTQTVAGTGLPTTPGNRSSTDGALTWADGAKTTLNDKVLRPASDPFQATGGLVELTGNLGEA
jgi:phosphogluconate dehydratase